jgi:Uma2 family endonuclease
MEACCLSNEQCRDALPDDCRQAGGRPQGPGTTCVDFVCVQPTVVKWESVITHLRNVGPVGLEIPADVHGLSGFRTWVAGLDETAPLVHYSSGRVHLELSPQDYESHAPVVQAVNGRLLLLAEELGLGKYFLPPSWITNVASDLSTEPDGFLVRWQGFESNRVRINPERKSEMLGCPDMAFEAGSKSSAKKDLVELVEDYARAGVTEYWLVDCRREDPALRVLVLGPDGRFADQEVREGGWVDSPIWNRRFRLSRYSNRAGLADHRLEVAAGP